MYPEPGFAEFKTAALITAHLKSLGIKVQKCSFANFLRKFRSFFENIFSSFLYEIMPTFLVGIINFRC